MSVDGLDVGYDGWKSQGRPVWLTVGAPPGSRVLLGPLSPSSSEGQLPPSVGNGPKPKGPDSPGVHTPTCQALADRRLQEGSLLDTSRRDDSMLSFTLQSSHGTQPKLVSG